jgi:hypothetical protein
MLLAREMAHEIFFTTVFLVVSTLRCVTVPSLRHVHDFIPETRRIFALPFEGPTYPFTVRHDRIPGDDNADGKCPFFI